MPEPLMRYLIWPLVKFLVAFIIVQVIVAAMNWVERRLLGLMQARLGPNRVGREFGIPWGLAQIVADPIKFILKEDIVPSSSEKVAYFLGPMLPLIPAFLVFCLIPYGPPPTFVVTHVNVGLLLILALTSTGVYGIILGGWASNNKYSLMGGLRSAAQMVSYEVPFGLSIVGVLMLCGSFDLVHIINYQASHIWNLFPQLIAAFIFLVAMNAENNRTPFDLPEAESELVAGYHTEYSAMKFAFFMLAEYSSMIVNCCLMVSLFFGGWTLAINGYGLTTGVLRGWGLAGGILGALIFITQGDDVHADVHLVPRDVPALPLRPADGPRMEVDDSAGAGEHRRHRDRGAPRAAAQFPGRSGPLDRRGGDHRVHAVSVAPAARKGDSCTSSIRSLGGPTSFFSSTCSRG